jgi:hypothetical protein
MTHILADWKSCAVALAAGVFVFTISGQANAADHDLLTATIQANRASVESLRTLYVEVKRSTQIEGKAPHLHQTAQYWREPNLVRIIENSSTGEITDYRQAEGKIWSRVDQPTADKSSRMTGLLIDEANNYHIQCDAWKEAMFLLPRLQWSSGSPTKNPMKPYSVADALEKLDIRGCSWVNRKGRKLVEVQVREFIPENDTKWDYTIWFDPQVNWLVAEVALLIKGPNYTWDCVFAADGFSELAPSMFFPTSVRSQYKFGEGRATVYVTEFQNAAANRLKAPPFSKEIKIPSHGLRVTDRIDGTTYHVDSAGRKSSRPDAIREIPPPIFPPVAPVATASWFGDWRRWALLAGLAFAVLGWHSVRARRRRGLTAPARSS